MRRWNFAENTLPANLHGGSRRGVDICLLPVVVSPSLFAEKRHSDEIVKSHSLTYQDV